MEKPLRPFHLALPVASLQKAKDFYKNTFNCTIGRETDDWVDVNFFGHQITFHQDKQTKLEHIENRVDSKLVPIPHFGIVLTFEHWTILSKQLEQCDINFIIEPHIRFKGLQGEQATMFFSDPNHLNIEIKAFKDDANLFKK